MNPTDKNTEHPAKLLMKREKGSCSSGRTPRADALRAAASGVYKPGEIYIRGEGE